MRPVRRRARARNGDGEGVSLDGPALSVVLRNRFEEHEALRDLSQARSGSSPGVRECRRVPLRGRVPARVAGLRPGPLAAGSWWSGTAWSSARCEVPALLGRLRAGGGAAAAVSLPGVPGGDRGRPARIAASAVVRSGASSTGSGAVRAGCDERCGKGGDESVASCRHVGEGEVDHAQSVDRVGACSPRPTVHSSLLPPRNVASASLTSSTSSWFSTTGGTPTLSTVSFRAHHGRGLRRAG